MGNNDGTISVAEFDAELLGTWDANADQTVFKAEFVATWVSKYGDCPNETNQFFDAMDVIKDGKLTEFDLLFQMGSLDSSGDGVVSVDEFKAFVHTKHPSG